MKNRCAAASEVSFMKDETVDLIMGLMGLYSLKDIRTTYSMESH